MGQGHPVDRTIMLGFEGLEAPQWVRDRLAGRDVPGFTLFALNIEGTEQLASLNRDLHAGAATPRLVATDQEGGQLNAFGDGTPFAGNMALGAVGDEGLAYRVGRATGRELRAVGVTVNYAPVCDVASRPGNPSLGIRSFGEDPMATGMLAAAITRGLQDEGVAAVLKHFPGKGEARVDPHYELPVLDMERERFDQVEFPPFSGGIGAGARMVMMGHYACPQLTGDRIPASLSPTMVDGILRDDLGFGGVVITDALDMGAVQGESGVDAGAAVAAGVDLLLCARDPDEQERLRHRLIEAHETGRVGEQTLRAAASRVADLRHWLSGFQPPDLSVVGSPEHRALARELATRAITLVRDDSGLLPLRPHPDQRILAVMPEPTDLTPADTSSRLSSGLAPALERHHRSVTPMTVDHHPSREQIAAVVTAAEEHHLVVVGTATATAGQSEMVSALLRTETPTVTVAMRTPDDLTGYPEARTHLCSHGMLPPSLDALADVIFGVTTATGRLPVAIPGLYPAGHRA